MEISELIKTRKVEIPNIGVSITIRENLAWADQMEAMQIDDQVEAGKFMATKMIIDWNIEDKGKKLEINQETIRSLPADVMLPILAEIIKIDKEKMEKKNN